MVRWSLVAVAAAVSRLRDAVFAQSLADDSHCRGTTGLAGFFHGKQIAVLGSLIESRDLFRLEPAGGAPRTATSAAAPDATSKPIFVYWRERPTRMRRRDSRRVLGPGPPDRKRQPVFGHRLSSAPRVDHTGPVAAARTDLRHPNASLVEATLPEAPTLRAIALAPERYRIAAPPSRAVSAVAIFWATSPRRCRRLANGTSCCSRQMPRSGSAR